MQKRFLPIFHFLVRPFVALGGALCVVLVVIFFVWRGTHVSPSGQYVSVVAAPITATGGAHSDLSFQISGQVVAIPATIGKEVSVGTSLVVLDQSALLAARAGAVASLEAAQARLAAVQAGTRPEQISVNQTAVTQAEETLRDAVRSSYVTADDAVHNKADQFFTNPDDSLAALSFTLPDQTLQNALRTERIALETTLNAWSMHMNDGTVDPLTEAEGAQADLLQVSAFLNDAKTALTETQASAALPLATLHGYQADINTARLGVSGAISSLTNAVTAVKAARGALVLAQAGSTKNDIAVAQAAVDAARATVSGIDVSLRQSTLTAPIDGTIVTANAHLGQTVSPGQILISIESSGGTKENALVIPKSSVIEDGGQAFVYVKDGAHAPVKTFVTVGLVSADGMAEIVSGLQLGQEVLAFGVPHK